MNNGSIFLLCIIFLISNSFITEARTNKPSGRLSGSPPVTSHTEATLTLNCFEPNCDRGGPSECDGKYHSDNDPIVALSTGWYNKGRRCGEFINIHSNGRSVQAKVVDECDSNHGCRNNNVDGSKAVWQALGVPEKDWGEMKVYWSD